MLKSGRYLQPERNRRYADFWRQRSNYCFAGLSIVIISIVATVGVIYLIVNGTKNKTTYTGDMLLRVFPKSERDKIFLQNFDTLNIDAKVWGWPVNNDAPVYIYAHAGSMHRLEKTLNGRNLTFNILIENVQKLIDREQRDIAERQSQQQSSDTFDFGNYHSYEQIVEWLKELSNTSRLVKIISMGKTHEQNDMLLVTISDSFGSETSDPQVPYQSDKPVIYINCGIHAREWVSISSCVWMINELVNSNHCNMSHLLDTYDFWFVPVSNPDGYIYSWTIDRLWRKNRSPAYECYGVDLNRNFDIGFNNTARTSCSSDYGGLEPGSQEETKAMIKLLQSNHHRVKAALFLHSFSQLWLSPFGVNSSYPNEYPEMERVMMKAVTAVKTTFGTDYKYGSAANVLYSAPGTAIDYCYEKLGIIYSFVVELRDQGSNAFMLPIEEIKPTAIETWNGIIAMALAIKEKLLL